MHILKKQRNRCSSEKSVVKVIASSASWFHPSGNHTVKGLSQGHSRSITGVTIHPEIQALMKRSALFMLPVVFFSSSPRNLVLA